MRGGLPPGQRTKRRLASYASYADHQFGHFVPQLGDGRAILLGEVVDRDGRRRDIQLKGSGPTPFSRRGDGRAVLGPVLREYLVSEAMHALGIPTTRALAAVTTGEGVRRETVLPGAILTRVAASHVRVGTFQFFAVRGDDRALQALLDFAIVRHYPEAADAANPALAVMAAVMQRQAALVARWLGVGFVHGVMNTDNTSISGETIDYGPCAFMDRFHMSTVFSSIDHGGRYAYAAQSKIIGWNMARLAETLLPLIDADAEVAIASAQELIEGFPSMIEAAWLDVMRAKLGLMDEDHGDRALILGFLSILQASNADFTNTFRALCDAASDPSADSIVRAELDGPERYDEWANRWRARLIADNADAQSRRDRMRCANLCFWYSTALIQVAAPADDTERLQRPVVRIECQLASWAHDHHRGRLVEGVEHHRISGRVGSNSIGFGFVVGFCVPARFFGACVAGFRVAVRLRRGLVRASVSSTRCAGLLGTTIVSSRASCPRSVAFTTSFWPTSFLITIGRSVTTRPST